MNRPQQLSKENLNGHGGLLRQLHPDHFWYDMMPQVAEEIMFRRLSDCTAPFMIL
jgi:hypothetical protein